MTISKRRKKEGAKRNEQPRSVPRQNSVSVSDSKVNVQLSFYESAT